MRLCWKHDPKDRPNFEQICEMLDGGSEEFADTKEAGSSPSQNGETPSVSISVSTSNSGGKISKKHKKNKSLENNNSGSNSVSVPQSTSQEQQSAYGSMPSDTKGNNAEYKNLDKSNEVDYANLTSQQPKPQYPPSSEEEEDSESETDNSNSPNDSSGESESESESQEEAAVSKNTKLDSKNTSYAFSPIHDL